MKCNKVYKYASEETLKFAKRMQTAGKEMKTAERESLYVFWLV
jgi:hypothetical protein